jgi:hypothetical protein
MQRLSLYKAALLAAFGVLQIADVITTRRVLDNGGWEANPFWVWTMKVLGAYWPVPKLVLQPRVRIVSFGPQRRLSSPSGWPAVSQP